jgi:precorrin-6A/cobalt-precorrin-6A reductase
MHILLLGGTSEASQIARALAQAGLRGVYSYAGRTSDPVEQPLPVRVGGFGGGAGLRSYLKAQGITHIIDATHPFAERMSSNAAAATGELNLPLIRFERPPWTAQPGDRWQLVARMQDLPGALPDRPARVFLAIGKQQLDLFAARPQHHYLLRLVDAPAQPLPLRDFTVVTGRGPFDVAGDTELLRAHAITHVVAKNAGGSGASAKLVAARALGLKVIMADRPPLPSARTAGNVQDVMTWLSHSADLGV